MGAEWERQSEYTKHKKVVGSYSHSEPKGVVGDRRFCIVPPLNDRAHISERGVPLVAMIASHWDICNGATIHWCACRVVIRNNGPVPRNVWL